MKSAESIKTIGIIGAGTMGSGIASSSAISGFKTLLYDINIEIVNKSIEKIVNGFTKLVEKGKIDKSAKESAVKNLSGVSKLEEFSGCDFIIRGYK